MDTLAITKRFKDFMGFVSDKEAADFLDISQQDFANRKQRSTFIILLIDKIVHLNVNLHWLITGQGEIRIDKSDQNSYQEILEKYKIELNIGLSEIVNATLVKLEIELSWDTKIRLISVLYDRFMPILEKEIKKSESFNFQTFLSRKTIEIRDHMKTALKMAKV